jgi:hypothetical protein
VGVIQPAFLAQLRQRCRAELVLVMVQLEQLFPGHWPDIADLADQLATDRATLNRSMRQLEDLGLLRRVSIGNGGGTWIWWVARHDGDQPPEDAEPAWVLRDLRGQRTQRVTVTHRWDWARRHGIPRGTMRSFLTGGQLLMRNRWQLVATPYDEIAA